MLKLDFRFGSCEKKKPTPKNTTLKVVAGVADLAFL
jgi:hypothetical protein